MLSLFAQTGKSSTSPPSAAFFWLVVVVWICYSRRNKPIGGWLLFYIIQIALASIAFIPLTISQASSYVPSSYQNPETYIAFLLSTIPGDILFILQFVLLFWLVPKRKRTWRVIKVLKIVLAARVVSSLIAVGIDFFYWENAIALDALSLLWSLAWLPYFAYSRRVRSIYQFNNWDQLHFMPIRVTLPDQQAKNSIRTAPQVPMKGEYSSDAEFAAARIAIGNELVKKGEYEDAEKEYRGALKVMPGFTEANYRLASCCAFRGMKQEALDNLRKAVEHGYDSWPRLQDDEGLKKIKEDPWFGMLAEVVKARWEKAKRLGT